MFRWWLPAGYCDPATVVAEIQAVARAGFQGLEICINMDDSRYPLDSLADNGWGSPRWNALYKLILKTANANGVRIDTTISPAWPAAVPTIGIDDAAASQELIFGESETFTSTFAGPVPAGKSPGSMIAPGPPPGGPPNVVNGDEKRDERLVTITAARVLGRRKVSKSFAIQWGDMPGDIREHEQDTVLLDFGSMVELPASAISADGKAVRWKAPGKGEWKIFSFWSRGTGQSNKGGRATAGRNLVIDHFGEDGTREIIDFWEASLLDAETRDLLRANGGIIFEDSLELEYHGMIWTPQLLDEFRTRRGYDLAPYLPLLAGMNLSGMANQANTPFEPGNAAGGEILALGDAVRRDFKECLTELYIDRHVAPIKGWAAGLGLGYRAQSYGAAFDIVATSAASGGADGESLGFGPGERGDDRFRMICGAVHAAGQTIVADEAGAIANEGYRLTWRDMLRWVNRNYGAGANQMIFHGLAHADAAGARWPGYSPFGFGLAEHWGPRHPNWMHIADLAAYLRRVQDVLQAGRARPDFAVLNHQYGTASPVIAQSGIADHGYCYDILSPRVLLELGGDVRAGALFPDGPGYRALVVAPTDYTSSDLIARLNELADKGLPIVLTGDIPADPAFLPEREAPVAAQWEALSRHPQVARVAAIAELPRALSASGIAPAALPESPQPVLVQHRQNDGRDTYLLANHGEKTIEARYRFAGEGTCVGIDPWSGREVLLGTANEPVDIRLTPGQTLFVKSGGEGRAYPAKASLETVPLPDTWHLSVERWQDDPASGSSADTLRSKIEVGPTQLVAWKDIASLGPAVSGIGRYVARLSLPRTVAGNSSLQLAIPIGGWASARATIGGRTASVDPMTGQAMIEGPFRPGRTVIEIELATTLGNQLIADGAITDSPWDPNAKAVVEDYGLLAGVSLEVMRERS